MSNPAPRRRSAAIVKERAGNDEKKYGGCEGSPRASGRTKPRAGFPRWLVFTQRNTKISHIHNYVDNFMLQRNIFGCRHT
jgi:hypothetical protein